MLFPCIQDQTHAFDAIISEKESAILEVRTLLFAASVIVRCSSQTQTCVAHIPQKSRRIDELKATVEEYSALTEVSLFNPPSTLPFQLWPIIILNKFPFTGLSLLISICLLQQVKLFYVLLMPFWVNTIVEPILPSNIPAGSSGQYFS